LGITEVLVYTQLKKGTKYRVDLRYDHSIIPVSEFFTCPNFNLEVNVIPLEEAKKLLAQ